MTCWARILLLRQFDKATTCKSNTQNRLKYGHRGHGNAVTCGNAILERPMKLATCHIEPRFFEPGDDFRPIFTGTELSFFCENLITEKIFHVLTCPIFPSLSGWKCPILS